MVIGMHGQNHIISYVWDMLFAEMLLQGGGVTTDIEDGEEEGSVDGTRVNPGLGGT